MYETGSKTLFNGAWVPRLPRIVTQKCRSERLAVGFGGTDDAGCVESGSMALEVAFRSRFVAIAHDNAIRKRHGILSGHRPHPGCFRHYMTANSLTPPMQ